MNPWDMGCSLTGCHGLLDYLRFFLLKVNRNLHVFEASDGSRELYENTLENPSFTIVLPPSPYPHSSEMRLDGMRKTSLESFSLSLAGPTFEMRPPS
jgi:hypothetical protein